MSWCCPSLNTFTAAFFLAWSKRERIWFIDTKDGRGKTQNTRLPRDRFRSPVRASHIPFQNCAFFCYGRKRLTCTLCGKCYFIGFLCAFAYLLCGSRKNATIWCARVCMHFHHHQALFSPLPFLPPTLARLFALCAQQSYCLLHRCSHFILHTNTNTETPHRIYFHRVVCMSRAFERGAHSIAHDICFFHFRTRCAKMRTKGSCVENHHHYYNYCWMVSPIIT